MYGYDESEAELQRFAHFYEAEVNDPTFLHFKGIYSEKGSASELKYLLIQSVIT